MNIYATIALVLATAYVSAALGFRHGRDGAPEHFAYREAKDTRLDAEMERFEAEYSGSREMACDHLFEIVSDQMNRERDTEQRMTRRD